MINDWIKLLIVIFLNTGGQLSLKIGSQSLQSLQQFLNNPTIVLQYPYFILGTLLYGLSLILYVHVLSRVELSVAYPFMSLSYVLVIFASSFILNETVGAKTITGSLLVFAGLTLIGLEAS